MLRIIVLPSSCASYPWKLTASSLGLTESEGEQVTAGDIEAVLRNILSSQEISVLRLRFGSFLTKISCLLYLRLCNLELDIYL